MADDIIQRGEAYILRTCAADMTSRGGFAWPREGSVEAPDWQPTTKCGAGLHGFLWGEGDGSLADWSADAVWIVARIEEWIDLVGKAKFPRAEVVFSGSKDDAAAKLRGYGASGAIVGGTATAGDGGTATAGDRGIINLSWWDGRRKRVVIAYVGEDGVEAGKPYTVRDGKVVEAA